MRPHAVAAPVSAKRPLLVDTMTMGEAMGVILRECLAQIGANVPAVVEARNGEGLHQLRVGLRRLRTALRLTGAEALEARAKAIITTIGAARDLDVFRDEMFAPAVEALGPRRGFELLAERIAHRHEAAWQTTIGHVTDPQFVVFHNDVSSFADTCREDAPVMEAAPALLDHARRKAKQRGRHFASLDPAARHRLRIALKRLRYAGEFFAPLYSTKRVKHWLEPLKTLQDELGHLNDIAQVRVMVGRLLLEEAESASVQADLSHAAGLLQGFYQTQALAEKTGKRWKAFRDSDPYWI